MSHIPTTAQRRWWSKFRKTLESIPPDMEVIVSAYGCAQAAPRGAVERALKAGGDAGSAETILLTTIDVRGLVDGSGGL